MLLVFSLMLKAQTTKTIIGIYKSQELYGDVWALNLVSDSTYTFSSELESMGVGTWSVRGNILILNYEKTGHELKMKLKHKGNTTIIRPKFHSFRKMKLSKS